MSTIRYLAYGSNLYPPRLAARLGDIRSLGTVALPGWELRFHKAGADGSGKCDLVADPEGLAFGAVYEITAADRTLLDRIEGIGHGYHGALIEVEEAGELYVYCAQASHIDASLTPFDWYHGFVLAGARHHAFPRAYVTRIQRIATVRDDDAVRRKQNLKILG